MCVYVYVCLEQVSADGFEKLNRLGDEIKIYWVRFLLVEIYVPFFSPILSLIRF